MIAVDTNLLVYAHRRDSAFHATAADRIERLAEGRASWAIPWPCVHEFFSVVTHPRIYAPASTPAQAVAQIDAWLESPSVLLLVEGPDHWATLRTEIVSSKIAGPTVHDARVAALCLQHGVRELWSVDRDFNRFPRLRVVNPLVD